MPLRETLHSISKTIEVKPTDDEYEKIDTTRWGNRDTYPVPSDKRTYGVYAYMAYWGKSFDEAKMIVYTNDKRYLRHLSQLLHDRFFSHRHRLDSLAGHDICRLWHDSRLWQCLFLRCSRCQIPLGLRSIRSCCLGPLGVLFLHHAQHLPMVSSQSSECQIKLTLPASCFMVPRCTSVAKPL